MSLVSRARSYYQEALDKLGGAGGDPERVRGAVESLLRASLTVLTVPVEDWRPRTVLLEPGPGGVEAPVYSGSGEVEAPVVRVTGDPYNPRSWRPGAGIAHVRLEGWDPFQAKRLALHAWEAGYEALIIEAPTRPAPAPGLWGYSYHAGQEAPIPVVWAPLGRAPEGRARLLVEARVEPRRGVNLAWGWGENPVLVAAPWKGAGWARSVAAAVAATRLLIDSGVDVALALFDAGRHGAPGPAGWHWAWGSRWHAQQLARSGALEGVRAYLSFDLAGGGPLTVSGAPQYEAGATGLLVDAGVPVGYGGWECVFCDGYSLASAGVPGVSLHRWDPWSPGGGDEGVPEGVAALVGAVLGGADYGVLYDRLEEALSANLYARMILETIVRAAAREGWDRVYRVLGARWLRPYYLGDYRLDPPGRPGVCMFPESCVLGMGVEGRRAVWVPGEERLLYVPGGRLGVQAASLMGELLWRVREELG